MTYFLIYLLLPKTSVIFYKLRSNLQVDKNSDLLHKHFTSIPPTPPLIHTQTEGRTFWLQHPSLPKGKKTSTTPTCTTKSITILLQFLVSNNTCKLPKISLVELSVQRRCGTPPNPRQGRVVCQLPMCRHDDGKSNLPRKIRGKSTKFPFLGWKQQNKGKNGLSCRGKAEIRGPSSCLNVVLLWRSAIILSKMADHGFSLSGYTCKIGHLKRCV